MARWETRVRIENDTVHLGDRDIGDWPPPEGRTWRKWFVCDRLSSDLLYFVASVYQTDSGDSEIEINDRTIGELPRHDGRDFHAFARRIPAGLLRQGENELVIRAARLNEGVDNFLIRQMRLSRKIEDQAPTPSPPGTPGTGSGKEDFFRHLGNGLERLKWRQARVPGFGWSGLATHSHWLDTLFGFFDADGTDVVDHAYAKLNAWAEQQGDIPSARVAVAVFDRVAPEEIQRITRELQEGSRTDLPQRMTAVIDLRRGRFHEPQKVAKGFFGGGGGKITFNSQYGGEIQRVVDVLAG